MSGANTAGSGVRPRHGQGRLYPFCLYMAPSSIALT